MTKPDEPEIGVAGLARTQELTLAPDLEIALGELEAVRGGHHRLEPLHRALGELLAWPRDEQAVRLLGPSADASTQLVELREAEPVRLLDDHHGRVRHVHADLDHRGRDEDVELTGLEARHQVTPLGRPELPVDAADAEVAQLTAAQPLRLVLGRASAARLRLLDQRAHDVRLASLAQEPRHARVRLRARLLRDPRA